MTLNVSKNDVVIQTDQCSGLLNGQSYMLFEKKNNTRFKKTG